MKDAPIRDEHREEARGTLRASLEPHGVTLPDHVAEAVAQALANAEARGVKKGLWAYAWWKDGVQYVGKCGTTLKEAYRKHLGGTPEAKTDG